MNKKKSISVTDIAKVPSKPKVQKSHVPAKSLKIIPAVKGSSKIISMADLAKARDFSDTGKKPTKSPSRSSYKRPPRGKDFSDTGIPGLQIWAGHVDEEFLVDLKGVRGIRAYKEMRDNDATIGAMLYVIEQVIQRTTRNVIIDDKFKDDPEAEQKKMLVETALDDLSNPWQQVMHEILTCLTYGFSWTEITLKQRNGENRDPDLNSRHSDGLIGWKGIELRSQDSLDSWEMTPNGRIIAMIQQPAPDYQYRRIPYSKSMLFRPRTEKNNPEGKSLLRNAYRSFWFKKRFEEIEGIAVERELNGLPVLIPPEGYNLWNPNDADAAILLARAEDIVQNIRMDQHQGVVLPFGWTLELMASKGSRSVDTTMIIGRLEQRMAVTVLADMLLIGQDRVGSFALVSSKVQLFTSSLQFILNMIEDQFNRYAIPRLLRANGFDTDPQPKLKFGPPEQVDLKSFADYVEKLTGSKVLTPDDKLEEHLRRIVGFPEADPDTSRKIPSLEPPPPGSEMGGFPPSEDPESGEEREPVEEALPDHSSFFPKKRR